MSAIKRFFEKRKLDTKFKQAGSGQQLNAPSKKAPVGPSRPAAERQQPVVGARPGAAALARIEAQQSVSKKAPSSTSTSWKHKIEQDSNQLNANVKSDVPGNTSQDGIKMKIATKSSVCDIGGILFCCPLCPASLPADEIYAHIHECLLKELDAEPLMIAVTMVYTLNRDKNKVTNGVNVVSKYLQNIVDHPDDMKYRKIRKTNKVFQEKVANLTGIEEFLTKGCGFELLKLPFEVNGESSEHEFYVMNENLAKDTEQLSAAKQMLIEADPVDVNLDRNVKIYEPSNSAMDTNVPKSFYEVSTAEVKQGQMEMSTEVEKGKQLRTKAMRDGEGAPKRVYRYCIVRIRFPNGVLLQGTFSSSEKLIGLKNFIKEHLAMDWLPFTLVDSIGRPYLDENATLISLKLAPATLINFTIPSDVSEEIAASNPRGNIQYLADDYMALIQSLDTKY